MNVNTLLDCDALQVEAQQSMDLLNDMKSVLMTFANDLKSIDSQLKCGEVSNYSDATVDIMKRVISDNVCIKNSLLAAKQTLEMEVEIQDEDENLADLNACFNENLQQLSSAINYNNDPKFRDLVQLLSVDREAEDEDLETMETAPFYIPTDPFMKTSVENPVKNKRCGHVYDKKCFKQYLQMCANNPRKLICPIGGCQNKEKLTDSSVEDDVELRFKIRRAKYRN